MADIRPLIVLTRPIEAAEKFAEQLRDRFEDVEVLIAPLQSIEFLSVSEDFSESKGLIFTSQNGVLAWNRLENRPFLPAYCVGPQTTERAASFGLGAIDCGGNAEAVVSELLAKSLAAPLLHFRGEHGRGQIAERLTEAGLETREAVVYRQVSLDPKDELLEVLDRPDIVVPLFSPRSAKLFARIAPAGTNPRLAVISQAAAKALDPALQERMIVAHTPDREGMMQAIADCLVAG